MTVRWYVAPRRTRMTGVRTAGALPLVLLLAQLRRAKPPNTVRGLVGGCAELSCTALAGKRQEYAQMGGRASAHVDGSLALQRTARLHWARHRQEPNAK